MLTVGDMVKLTAIDLDYKGQGVCKPEGYVIFVAGLLPGECAEVIIEKLNKSFGEGSILKLLKISKDRTHDTSELGSIELYHLKHEKQIEWQEKITKDTFKKIADVDLEITKTLTDQRFVNYRNKSVFHVLPEPILKLGLYKRDYSLVQVPLFILADSITNRFVNLINRITVPIEEGVLKHVVFRSNEQNQILITFVATKKEVDGLEKLVDKLAREKEVVGITLNLKTNDRLILSDESIVLYGENEITQALKSFDVVINDRSFFQVNWPMMREVYEVIASYVDHGLEVVEAYSGIGSIGYSVYDNTKKITMIESNQENVSMAKDIIDKERLSRIEVIEDRAENVIKNYDGDILIVDPPRNGLFKRFIDQVLDMSFKRIIYLSCDVKSLARDINMLKEQYRVTHAYPIRMFPQTTSIETLIILDRI